MQLAALWTASIVLVGQLQWLATAAPSTAASDNYVAIVDAGSSGSRMYIYKWLKRSSDDHNGVPEVTEDTKHKIKPGLSSYSTNATGVREHLAHLIKFAKENVPSSKHADTPVYLMATAGLRLLEITKRRFIFEEVHKNLENKNFSPFKYDRANSRILSGEEEGAFAWITTNYLRGILQQKERPTATNTVGVLEMGGASAQIVFFPEGQLLADKFPVRVGAREYSLYVHSYLNYGQEQVQKRVRDHLVAQNPGKTSIANPCMLEGDSLEEAHNGTSITFNGGTADNYRVCKDIVETFVYKVPKEQCYPSPCTIGNTYQPAFGLATRSFQAIGAYMYTIGDIGALGTDAKLDFAVLETKAEEYCGKTLTEVTALLGSASYASAKCAMGSFIPPFLTDGLGFPRETPQVGKDTVVTVGNSIGDQEIGWTLGATLYELGRTCPVKSLVSFPSASVGTAPALDMLMAVVTMLAMLSSMLGR